MLLIRDVFHTKPGKAKELVKIFKQVQLVMEKEGFKNMQIMTDIVSTYWTVVIQGEVENLDLFEKHSRGFSSKPEVADAMKDYMSLVDNGYREIFRIE